MRDWRLTKQKDKMKSERYEEKIETKQRCDMNERVRGKNWQKGKMKSVLEFLKSQQGLGTSEEEGYRTGPPGYIGWRNSFLGIDSGAPYTFKNRGSERKVIRMKKGRDGDKKVDRWEGSERRKNKRGREER